MAVYKTYKTVADEVVLYVLPPFYKISHFGKLFYFAKMSYNMKSVIWKISILILCLNQKSFK
jgi:hypothetical protein